MSQRPSLSLRPSSPTSRPSRGQGAAHSLLRWAIGGALLGGLLTAALFAPASWLAARVQSATAGKVQLQDARGTIWSGSARLVLTGGEDSRDATTLPTRLLWTLRPGLGSASVTLQSDCCTTTPVLAQFTPGWNAMALRVSDSALQLPADMLTGLGTPWNTVALQGQLRLYTTGLALQYSAGRATSQGLTRLEALAVSSRLSPLKPLGSYRLDIQGGDTAQLHLSTLNGDLQLSGQGQWVGSRLRFNGEASASAEREAALSNLLNILGRREGSRSIITFG